MFLPSSSSRSVVFREMRSGAGTLDVDDGGGVVVGSTDCFELGGGVRTPELVPFSEASATALARW